MNSEGYKMSFFSLKRPVISEKTNSATQLSCYTFLVYPESTKDTIKNCVEKVFSVEVRRVNVCNQLGKVKRNGKRKNTKKAYVVLENGFTIDMTKGVE